MFWNVEDGDCGVMNNDGCGPSIIRGSGLCTRVQELGRTDHEIFVENFGLVGMNDQSDVRISTPFVLPL